MDATLTTTITSYDVGGGLLKRKKREFLRLSVPFFKRIKHVVVVVVALKEMNELPSVEAAGFSWSLVEPFFYFSLR